MDTPDRPDWLKVITTASPTQIRGTSPEGWDVHFRFRWGTASLTIDQRLVWTENYGHAMSGRMDVDLAFALITPQLPAHAAHLAASAALPIGPVPVLSPDEEAMMNRLQGHD